MGKSALHGFLAPALAGLALAVGCAGFEGGTSPSGTGVKRAAGKPAPSKAGSGNPTASPGTAASGAGNASPSPTTHTGTNVGAGIGGSAPPTATETLPPTDTATATPTPFGATGQEVSFSGTGKALAALKNAIVPVVLRQDSFLAIGANGLAGDSLGSPIGQPAGIAAEDDKSVWVLSTNPPHLDRLTLGSAGFASGTSVVVPASPVAVAAIVGEVWVAAAGGKLMRLNTASNATASFTGFGEPTSLALDSSSVWITSGGNQLFQVDRSSGALRNTFATGISPSAVCVDPSGGVWVANSGAQTATRVKAGVASTISLGATPTAVVSDARRVWFAVPSAVVTVTLDGTVEGQAAGLRFSPTSLALDGLGRVWALSSFPGQTQWIWGRKPDE